MRRLYFLLPDVQVTQQVVDQLLLKRINDHHIHIIAKEGIPLGDLPEANLLQKSDFIPALERGLAVGGITGLLAGVAAVAFPPSGLVLGGGAILATSLIGAGFGAWVSSMIGVDVHNSQIQQYKTAIDRGDLLMMVDVPRERVSGIRDLVHELHPQADMGTTEPQIPAFP